MPIKIADRLYGDFSKSFSGPSVNLVDILVSNGCLDLAVALEKEQISLSFTREVNLDRESFRKAIQNIKRMQGHLGISASKILVNEDMEAEQLLERLHLRIDNVDKDKYYTPDFEDSLRSLLNYIYKLDRLLREGVALFLSNYADVEAISWFCRILRGRKVYGLWRAQNPDSDSIDYGKEWRSSDIASNSAAASFFEVESVQSIDFWKRESESRRPYFHVWLDSKETRKLEEYHGLPGDFQDMSLLTRDKFIYPQMVLQHLDNKEFTGPVIWNLDDALVGIS